MGIYCAKQVLSWFIVQSRNISYISWSLFAGIVDKIWLVKSKNIKI